MKAYGSAEPPYWNLDSAVPCAEPVASARFPTGSHGKGESPRHWPERRVGSDDRRRQGRVGLSATIAANGASAVAKVLGPALLDDVHILIIDDCTLHRDNLAAVIAANGAAVSVAWDLPTLITAVRDTSSGIVLVNVATLDSETLLEAASTINPGARVIALGVSEDDESAIVACAEAGVAGYHTRNQTLEDLLVLMAKVAAGEAWCSPRVSAVLLRRLSALASQREPANKEIVLTAREAQILQMLRVGMSNRDIATQLCIAVHTVKNHVHSLLSKLGVSTRAEAAALSHGVRWTPGPQRN
jgi:DNA-binding NarL/FixJ family response regulator